MARFWLEAPDDYLDGRTFTAIDEAYRMTGDELSLFASGARRDTQEGKPRYDLISPLLLERLAEHLRKGAKHYGEHNWHKGIPSQRYMASLMRHVEQYRAGDRNEDHLSAIVFNTMGLMHNEGTELDDLYEW